MSEGTPLSPLQVLKLPNYREYWLSGLGMTASQNVQRLALAWLILELTDSLGQLGLMLFVTGLPMALVSLWGGVLADRLDRKRILMVTQGFTATNLLVLALLTQAELVETWHVYLSAAGLGVAQAMTMPARTAIVRNLVSPVNMKNAVALNTVQMQTAMVIWPLIAGLIIGQAGISATLLTSSGLAFAGIAFLSLVRLPPVEPPDLERSPLRELKDGLKFSLTAPKVSSLMVMAIFVGILGLPFMSMSPGYAKEVLGFGAGMTGVFLMVGGLGSIAGSVFILAIKVQDNLRLYFVGAAFMGLSIALLALSPWAIAAFLPAAMFGFCLSVMIVGGQTLIQSEVPGSLLGRTSSVWSLVAAIGFIASLPIGIVGDVLGLPVALGGAAALLVACVLINGGVRTRVLLPRREAAAGAPVSG